MRAPEVGYQVVGLSKNSGAANFFGQTIFEAGSVFSYFTPSYQPAGAVASADAMLPGAT